MPANATLKIAPGLSLATDYATQACAILAQRRKGKTYTASVIAEEFCETGQPFVTLDPTGAWWGLRSEYPVVILGGEHGDVPLEDTAGKLVADLVVDHPGFYVLDVSAWETRAAEVRFARDFAERLYRRKAKHRDPLHLFFDEAELFAPQRTGPDEARMLGAVESIVKRGGIRGLGTTLISQRAAAVNKNVLEQIDILIALRIVGPNDRKAIDGYVAAYATGDERDRLMGSLASLDLGEAWVYEPGADLLKRVKIRQRRTFNSSATPKPGERKREPQRLAAVDLDALRDRMKATVERQQADDPKALRKRIVELERELAQRPEVEPERVEVPVVTQEDFDKLEASAQALEAAVSGFRDEFNGIVRPLGEQLLGLTAKIAIGPSAGRSGATPGMPQRVPSRASHQRTAGAQASPAPPRTVAPSDNGGLPKAQRKIMTVLAQFPDGRTKQQLAMLTGYSAKGGGFNNALGALRSVEYINRGEPIVPTAAGLDALGDWEPLPTGRALLDHWLNQLGKAERAILETLAAEYPHSLTKEDVAYSAGYESMGGGFNNALGRLRTLELINRGQEIRLDETLGEAVR